MEKFYTTGEVARLCNTTVRTVQFYDKRKLVSPKKTSEGGRRLYSEADIERFHSILLYKEIGFCLEEIKAILEAGNEVDIVRKFIQQHEDIVQDKQQELILKQDRLQALDDEITRKGKLTTSNFNELNGLVKKRKQHNNIQRMTYLLLTGYCLLLFTGFPLAVKAGGIYPIIFSVVSIVLLVALIYYHASKNAYVCPHCKKEFTLTFFKDAITLNNGKKGKLLTCPYCGHRSTMKETYKWG